MPSLDIALIVLAGIALFAAFVNGAVGYGFSSLTVTLAPTITRLLHRYHLRAVISWSPNIPITFGSTAGFRCGPCPLWLMHDEGGRNHTPSMSASPRKR